MAEEQYVNMTAQAVAGTLQAGLTAGAAVSLLFGDEQGEVLDWLEKGNSIEEFHIPRMMYAEFEQEMNEKGIPFVAQDTNHKGEFISITVRGPERYEKTFNGEYTFSEEDGKLHRIAAEGANGQDNGDAVQVKGIVNKYFEKYKIALDQDYALNIDKANEMFAGKYVTRLENLSFDEAIIVQDMASKNMLYTDMRYSPETDTYAVEFLEEDAKRDSITFMSPVELTIQQSLYSMGFPAVEEYLKMSKNNDLQIKELANLINNDKILQAQNMVIFPIGNNEYHSSGYQNEYIKVNADKTATFISHEDGNIKSINYNLSRLEDYEAFSKKCADLGAKGILSQAEFDIAMSSRNDFNRLIGAQDIAYQKYEHSLELGRYEAEKLTDYNMMEVKFDDTPANERKHIEESRFMQVRIPDSDTIIDVVYAEKKDSLARGDKEGAQDLTSQIADAAPMYEELKRNIELRKAHMIMTPAAKYEEAGKAFYRQEGELLLDNKAYKASFDQANVQKEVVKDIDHDGVEDDIDSFIDMDHDGEDDREEEFEMELDNGDIWSD